MIDGTAIVVKNAGSHFLLSRLPEWKLFPAVLRGKVRLEKSEATNPITVGDKVRFEIDNEACEENPATITEILPRNNYIIRKSTNLSRQSHVIAANIDLAIVVVSLYYPEIKYPFLDRILVTCEVYGVPVAIILNKVDLYRNECKEQIDNFKQIYSGAGYKVLETSTLTGEGAEELRGMCKDKICLVSGESGVGKSSIIRMLDSNLNPKVGLISESHLQGKHTTSLYEMYKLECGGFIIDTPGLRGFGLSGLEKEEISKYFPEMLRVMDGCRFAPCTHTHEPECAVKAALDSGQVSLQRYNSYLGMLEEDTKFR